MLPFEYLALNAVENLRALQFDIVFPTMVLFCE
jgi:hypothetical protein